MYNCVVTNVPGSRVPLYFAGARMVAMYGTAPVFDGMGLICPVYSYGPTIAISFTADRDMLPDPDRFAAALRSSFAALKAAAQTRSAERGPAPPVETNDNPPVPTPASRRKGTING